MEYIERTDIILLYFQKTPSGVMKGEFDWTLQYKDDFHPRICYPAKVRNTKDKFISEEQIENRHPQQYSLRDRAHFITHSDKHRLGGEYDRPQALELRPTERAVYSNPRGSFRQKAQCAATPSSIDDYTDMKDDRVEIKNLVENLGSQGLLERTPRPTDDYHSTRIVKAVATKPQDTLRLKGNFERLSRTRDEFKSTCGHRAEIKNPIDTLRHKGEIDWTPKNQDDVRPTRNDRAKVRKTTHNLKSDGEFSNCHHHLYTLSDRADIISYPDNFTREGDYERRQRQYLDRQKKLTSEKQKIVCTRKENAIESLPQWMIVSP
jgi:hypothetical protein